MLCAVLGLDRTSCPRSRHISAFGRKPERARISARPRRRFKLPVLTKPASVKHLSGKARSQFEAVVRATDVFELARPGEARPGGLECKCRS